MSVRAKFKVMEKTEHANGMFILKLSSVGGATGGESEENKTFWKYTPAGSLDLHTINPEAAKQFEVGKEYYLDFTLAE